MNLGISLSLRGNLSSALSSIRFYLNILTLNDTLGNVGQFTRAGVANSPDYQGTLIQSALDQWRVNYGRWNGTAWADDDGAGNPLHPKRTINGAPTYLDIKAWVTGAFTLGDMVETGGRYYQASASGTDVAFNSSGLWVDKGIYNRGFGVLLEGGTTNSIPAANYRTAAMWTIVGAGTAVADQVGLDGSPNKAITLTDADVAFGTIFVTPVIAIPANTATHFRKCAIKKDPTSTTAVMILGNLTGGTPQYPAFVLNPVDGAFSSGGVNAIVESVGDWWICSFSITNNGTNTQIAFHICPARRTYGGIDDTTLTGSCVIDFPMIELNVPYASSFIAGGTTRQDELGNLKFPTTAGWKGKNAFPQASGTIMATWLPQFASGDIAAANRVISTISGTAWSLLRQRASGTNVITTSDSTTESDIALTAWQPNDAIQLFVRWGRNADPVQTGLNRLQLIFRNATLGESLTYALSAAYDGNFTDTGFLQFLMSGGGNNSGFRNAQIFDKPLTNNEIQGYVIS
ncbi:MAG: hypothetical protein JKY80_01985 [Mariprofundaceae bacterium]|nr:hypothetical protein [Methylophaga sp.]MBL4759610.1 hypothetical protein [Mariprofundaceae bacterium]